MKKILFGQIMIMWFIGTYSFAMSGLDSILSQGNIINTVPYKYTISFLASTNSDQLSSDDSNNVTTDTTYKAGTLLAEYVYPRSNGFASFLEGSCTEYVAKQRPDLFLNDNGSRRITGNAEDRLHNAKRLGIELGSTPKKGSIAVYYNGHGGREYGHVAYVEDVQANGVIVVSEMNYKEEYVVTLRAVDSQRAAGYIY